MLTTQDIIQQVLEILDSYTGPDLHVEQALAEIREQILKQFNTNV